MTAAVAPGAADGTPARILSSCPRDCYDGCGLLLEPRPDGSVRVLGDPAHPVARGRLCGKCAVAYNGVWQDPSARLLYPLRRSGPKGSGRFERIDWDTALAIIAARLHETLDRRGPQAILHTHYTGTLSLLAWAFPLRFFHRLGATEVEPDTICNLAGHVAWNLLFGESAIGFDPRTVRDSRCVLVWGANPAHTAPHTFEHWLASSGVPVVVVDPLRTGTAAAAALHLQPRPGTDAALAYALLHVLRREGRFDADFIAAHTLGADEVLPLIETCTPAWGEDRTGVPAADIERAARLYGAGPALLWAGQGLQRQPGGGNVMRAIGLLPALTGNVGKPGAGFCYINVTPAIAGMDLDDLAGRGLARGARPAIGHMEFAAALADPERFRDLLVWNTNPLASAPRQAELRRAFAREDLFTVAIDCFATDTCDYADIVLPAAGLLEFDDLTFSYFHLHLGAQVRARTPLGEALPNQAIFRRLARAMGFDEPELQEPDAAVIARLLAQTGLGLDFAALARAGHVPLGAEPVVFHADRRFGTPSGRIEIASARAQEAGLPRVPLPHADAVPREGRLRLLTPASRWRLNDAYANDETLAARSGPATVSLHPEEAARRGIVAGAAVRLGNATGALVLAARLDDAVPPGIAVAYKGRWPKREPAGANVNVLNPGQCADMGDSSAVHGIEVTIAPA